MKNNENMEPYADIKKSLLEYKGHLTSDVRVQLLDMIKCVAINNMGPRTDLKKLIGIALELLDNAQRYNTGTKVDFRWHIQDTILMVTIKNPASRTDAERLVEAVKAIEQMNSQEISEAFQKQLTGEGFGEKGGAGLGMLQIARKVGKNISVTIEPLGDDEFTCTSQVTAQLDNPMKKD